MRIADAVTAKKGGANDREWFGALTSLAVDIARAECFELAPDVVETIENVRHSRPSSIESALPFARLPYPIIWVEWCPVHMPWKRPIVAGEFAPPRSGFLIKQGDTPADGFISWVFQHPNGNLYPLPVGMMFDWERQFPETTGISFSEKDMKSLMSRNFGWRRLATNPKEVERAIQLTGHMFPCVPDHMQNFVRQTEFILMADEKLRLQQACLTDLEGEPAFAQAFMIMLNTRDLLQSSKEAVGKLNKSRRRLGRHPLIEFAVTRLLLGRRAKQLAGGGEPSDVHREIARQHLVRGHFKARKTGVFWWSPFVRGNPDDAIPRARYAVSG